MGLGMKIRVRNNSLPKIAAMLPHEMHNIVEGAGKVGVKVARSRVPVLTGALKESIHVANNSGTKCEIKSDLDYAAIIEYGGVNRAPQPYMRPAALAATIYLKKEISGLAGRIERQA
jgi:bacteriophage HK97-gp10 putative tail-component